MHSTPLTTALTLCLTFLISSVFAAPLQDRDYSKSDLPPAVWRMCVGGENATIVHSSAPVEGATGLVLTTGSCIKNGTASQKRQTPSLDVRASCPTVHNACLSRFSSSFPSNWINQGWVPKCGASCTSACYSANSGGPGPDPNHCQRIFDTLIARPDQVFTVEPGDFLLYTVSTCGTAVQNQIAANPTNSACSRKMIYDYTDWAGVGNFLAWNCQATQGARGGICMGNTGIFTNVPDFFIQVYRNQ